jgi:hypothetical protein
MTPSPARIRVLGAIALASLALGACKPQEVETAGELGDACVPEDESPCVEGLVCEPRSDDAAYICAGPIELRGMVIDALDETPIEGARVIALDDTSAPVSDIAITDAEGHYSLPIAVPRDSDGNPATALTLTLQGSAADLIKLAMIHIHDAIREEGLASRMLLQVHDELVFEVPPAELDTMRALVRTHMEGAAELAVPLVVDVGVGPNWLEAKR